MPTFHVLDEQICPHRDSAAHGVEVPPGARLLFTNGQVGSRLDGTVPDDPRAQVDIIFDRLATILKASNMTFADVIKFSIYVTNKAILDDYVRARTKYVPHAPAATLLIVGPFPRPGIQVEIEAIAAKVG